MIAGENLKAGSFGKVKDGLLVRAEQPWTLTADVTIMRDLEVGECVVVTPFKEFMQWMAKHKWPSTTPFDVVGGEL